MTLDRRSATIIGLGVAGLALAGTELSVSPSITLTDAQSVDLDKTAKPKIARMGNGRLVTVFADGSGPPVYDVKAQAERPARDIFSRQCHPNQVDCSVESNWSAPINLSESANLSSIATQWKGPALPSEAFMGDVDKPNVFNNGNNLIVSWVSKYCPGDVQGTVSYLELDDREVPFSCTWTARSFDGGVSWSPAEQLSDGYRDAKQDVSRGSTAAWVVTWQEDPQGLQRGEADGPGDGASGAKVSHGTDIWYSYVDAAGYTAGTPFSEPVRITNNFTKTDNRQNGANPVESGQEGASRANTGLVGPTVLVAYEETKGSEGLDSGKYVRYHTFPFDQPPASCQAAGAGTGDTGDTGDGGGACETNARGEAMPMTLDPARMGCIVSDPDENARRVRFLTQGTPGPNSTIKLFMFWKQGLYDNGGPSDIVGRYGYAGTGTGPMAGFSYGDLSPAIALPTAVAPGDTPDGCLIRGDEATLTGAFGNQEMQNFSTVTEQGGDLTLGTDDDHSEDARAHRGAIKGDFIALGYSYTPDWAVARFTDQENYEFWIRTTTNGGQTWNDPVDVTSPKTAAQASAMGLPPEGVNVKEPRIVKTPPNGPGCTTGDPNDASTTNPLDCTSPQTFIVAWGTETNVYEHLGGSDELDVYITRSRDRGVTYEPPQLLAGRPDAAEFESQLRPTPSGDVVYSVWGEDASGVVNAPFAVSTGIEVPDTTTEYLLVVNEILADPDPVDGDANCDGTVDAADDRFVEIVNLGPDPVDLTGGKLTDSSGERHIFPTGTELGAYEGLVVYGGGNPSCGIDAQVASSGGLGLSTGGDTVSVYKGDGELLASVTYGSNAGNNVSLTLDPELDPNGMLRQHQSMNGNGASPGTLESGLAFTTAEGDTDTDTDADSDTDTDTDTDSDADADTDTDPVEEPGCGCSSPGSLPAFLPLLGGLLFLRRRG